MGYLRPVYAVGRALLDMAVVTAIIIFVPGLPPYMNFEAFYLTPPMPLEGKLAPNNILDKAIPLLKDQILGPESIAVRKDELFTGVIGGDIIRYKNGKMDVVVRIGKDCEGQYQESICGRPLGMRFGPNGKLIVADAYYGLFSVDVDSKKVETLVSINDEIDGKKPRNPNDLDIAKDGTIYWSDSSTNVFLQDATIEFLGEPSGRLLKYDPKTKKTETLINGLAFANGVQLSKNEDFVLVSESARGRVLQYHLKGAKKGQQEVFIDGLPGAPDNIRADSDGTIYISLIVPRFHDKFGVMDALGPHPYVRKFVLRLLCLVKGVLSGVQKVVSVEFVDKAQYWLGHLELTANVIPRYGIVLAVDELGQIISSIQSPDGKVASISEFTIDNEGKFAYLGSPYNTEIWKIKVSDISTSKSIPEITLG